MRYITLPSGKQPSISTYVKAWKRIKELSPDTIVLGWSVWNNDTASEILREMRKGMHDRINKHLDRHGKRYHESIIPQLKYRVRLGLPYNDLYTG